MILPPKSNTAHIAFDKALSDIEEEVKEEAVVCVHCGCELDNGKVKDNNENIDNIIVNLYKEYQI